MNITTLTDLLSSSLFYETDTVSGQLHEIKTTAKIKAISKGLPTPKNEDWKYINLFKHITSLFKIPEYDTNISKKIKTEPSQKQLIVFVNGFFSEALSSYSSEIISVTIISDANMPASFNKISDSKNNTFADINTALFFNGVYIVCKSTESKIIELSIEHLIENNQDHYPLFVNPRLYISVEDSAHVHVEESYRIKGSHNIINEIVEISLENKASIDFTVNQTSLQDNFLIYGNYSSNKSASISTIRIVNAQTHFTRNAIHASLIESGSEANIYGAVLSNGTAIIDNHTVVNHIAPHCESNELFKHILDDDSTVIFNGKIYVFNGAQKTNAYQSNKTLLLSDNATINTKPQLEIFADDVKCSHGATSGTLDKEQLFYLISRGIPEQQAKGLLMKAFINEIVNNIPKASMKKKIDHIVNTYLSVLQ